MAYASLIVVPFHYLSASQEVGEVPVTVTTESGQVIGYTMFTYVDCEKEMMKKMMKEMKKEMMKEMVKKIVNDDALQTEFFTEFARALQKKNLASDDRKTEALGPLHVPHLGKSKIKFSPVSGIFAPYWYLISQVFNLVSYAFVKKIAKLILANGNPHKI